MSSADGRRSGRVTQAHVARRAGVSTATVSYVLNGRKDRANAVSAVTRRRVVRAASELDYRPLRTGRALSRGRTDVIGLIQRKPGMPSHQQLSREIVKAAERRGLSTIIIPEPDRWENLSPLAFDGLVDCVIDIYGTMPVKIRRLIADRAALALFADRMRPAGFDVVRQHRRQGMREAVAHLVATGRRRIAFLGNGGADRRAGVEEGLQAAGIAPDRHLFVEVTGEFQDVRQFDAIMSLLETRPMPDAIISATIIGAFATLQIARLRGIDVPEDLAVIGTGMTPRSNHSLPALTTVGMDPARIGPALDELLVRLEQPTLPGRTFDLPWHVTRRATT